MIRVYCDSNIFRMLKPASRQFNQQVFDLFENLRNNAVIVFSETHLDDLRLSDEIYRNQDLELMERYAGNLYLHYDHIDKRCVFEIMSPIEAFSVQNYDVYDTVLKNPLDLRSIIANMEDSPHKDMLITAADELLKAPIPGIGYNADGSISSFENIDAINKIIPNNTPTINLGQILEEIRPNVYSLLNSPGEFDQLRKKATEKLNVNDYNYNNWGLSFNEKLENTLIGKKYIDILRLLVNDHNKDDHWVQFQFAYYILEMLAITTEKVGKKRKKNSLLDLSIDCNHAFNAINCDYFVTNDRGLYDKCSILYNIFQITDTKLIDLPQLGELQIAQKVNFSYAELIELLLGLDESDWEDEYMYGYKLKIPFLHYFDIVAKVKDTERKFILYSSKDIGRSFVYKEIALVYNRLVDLLPGIETVEHVTEDELSNKSVPRNVIWVYPSAEIGICVNRDTRCMTLTIQMLAANNKEEGMV